MTTFILHGGYTGERNELNRGFFQEMVERCPEGGTILAVYFAREDEVCDQLFSEDLVRIGEAAQGKRLDTVPANKQEFVSQLESADVVYIRGGNTERLQKTLKKYAAFASLVKGKTVAGSSAGAYVLSAYYYSSSSAGVFKGFGFLPIRLVCHHESIRFPRNGDPIAALEETDKELELVVLRDFEWRVFERP